MESIDTSFHWKVLGAYTWLAESLKNTLKIACSFTSVVLISYFCSYGGISLKK